jgi:hypothetical protein
MVYLYYIVQTVYSQNSDSTKTILAVFSLLTSFDVFQKKCLGWKPSNSGKTDENRSVLQEHKRQQHQTILRK